MPFVGMFDTLFLFIAVTLLLLLYLQLVSSSSSSGTGLLGSVFTFIDYFGGSIACFELDFDLGFTCAVPIKLLYHCTINNNTTLNDILA